VRPKNVPCRRLPRITQRFALTQHRLLDEA
jgi:hypothetical protein